MIERHCNLDKAVPMGPADAVSPAKRLTAARLLCCWPGVSLFVLRLDLERLYFPERNNANESSAGQSDAELMLIND